MKSTMHLYQQQREPIVNVSAPNKDSASTFNSKFANKRLKEDAKTISGNTDKGNII